MVITIQKHGIIYLLLAATVLASSPVFATNGMNLEGYGPIATGMGGASMAYDNGAAAVMNNPATLGMMPEGDRLDVALSYLGPHIKASVPGTSARSSADAFFMPAIGWIKKSGALSYGIGMFSQGGMGTNCVGGVCRTGRLGWSTLGENRFFGRG